MANSSVKKQKIHPFDPQEIDKWSVRKHDVDLLINAPTNQLFGEGNISLDIEHDGKGDFVGLGIYDDLSSACFYWSDLNLAKTIILPKFIAHNGITDLYYLKQWGFKVDEDNLLWDTMLIAHILDSSRKNYGLKALAKVDLGVEWPSYEEICGKKGEKTLLDFPVEAVSEYNSCDTYFCYQLFLKQIDKLNG